MNDNLLRVIEVIAADIVALSREIIEQTGSGKNSLRDSKLRENVQAHIQQSESGVVIDVLFDNYIEYIETGRAPKQGKIPPIDQLRDWASNKGISTDNDTLWAIATAIWRDGIEPRPILSVLDTRMDEMFDNKWADMLFEAITKELREYFDE